MFNKNASRFYGLPVRSLLTALMALSMVLALGGSPVMAKSPSTASHAATVTVFATGFNNPRGLKFGPDGYLYVAEGGAGGTNSTICQCNQVPDVGPYTGGMTARISRVNSKGVRFTVVDGLPSSQTSAQTGSLTSGVADVAFIGRQLYAILAGAGCSHGVPNIPNGVIRVKSNGTWQMIANLSAFQQSHPVAHPNPGDFEPDGTWYSMVAANGNLYAVEPNHGELDRITPQGKISRVDDISASQGHIVPTSLDFYHGHFYVGNLTTFPLVQGAAKILKVSKSGQLSVFKTGLTNIMGDLYGQGGELYVLEGSVGVPFPTPGTGRILRFDNDGSQETVVDGLSLPTAMTFGPDGNLYVSVNGFGFPAGAGQVVEVHLK
jgi:hypothetical protein